MLRLARDVLTLALARLSVAPLRRWAATCRAARDSLADPRLPRLLLAAEERTSERLVRSNEPAGPLLARHWRWLPSATRRWRVSQLPDHGDEVLHVAFSPCGTGLATASRDHTCRVVQLDRDMAPLASVTVLLDWPCASVRFVGSLLVVSCMNAQHGATGGTVHALKVEWATDEAPLQARTVWGTSTWPWDIQPVPYWVGGGRGTGDAAGLLCSQPTPTGPLAGSFQPVWERSVALEPIQVDRHPRQFNTFHFATMARTASDQWLVLATGTNPWQCDVVARGRIRASEEAVELVDGMEFEFLDRHVVGIVTTPDGWLVMGTRAQLAADPAGPPGPPPLSGDVEVQLRSPETLELLRVTRGPTATTPADAPFLIWADAADQYLACGGEDSLVHVWHRDHGVTRVLTGHTDIVNAAVWRPGHPGQLASCSDDWTVRLWAAVDR